ncbi:SusC/RagA family TonB-linked outer membrane protein [Maribacter thermophilus]|uniref:SusC/RagA family TonB-linked outer membrane protein n=1 Tax=Maribacter thermophilus TaxID=1197874 RepID=UPI000640CACA|nr:TonB-dependent receptor [Maribacter thermophilus]
MKKTRFNKNEGCLPLCGNKWVLRSVLIMLVHLTGTAYAVERDETDKRTVLWPSHETTRPQSVIRGTVSDELGPLAGVTIIVKGTTKGTTTDFDGNYSLEVDDADAVLVFSYIGYATQEIPVKNGDTINVVMVEDASKLEEVVVLGYTTKKKGELTGSVSTIDSKSIEQSSNKDLAKSLAGRASGLIINDRGGLPGAGNGAGNNTDDDATTILIRGKSTLNNNSPLILIDGIQAGSFSNLSPQDIASLTVLKDGAAAIYGSRAANGVILITTKRGASGKPKINFTTSYNISSFTRAPSLMSSEQYAIYENEIASRYGLELPYSQGDIQNYAAGTDPIQFPNTDWAALTFAKSSPESRNTISISGGGESVKYFVSGDVLSQEGIYKSGSLDYKQKQVRSNLDIDISDDIKLGVDLLGSFGNREQPGVDDSFIYKHIYTNLPTQVGLYPNGLPGFGGENGANPFIMSSNQSGFIDTKSTDLRGKFSLDINLNKIVNGLRFKGFAGVRKMNNDEKSWYTPWTYYTFQAGTNEYIPQTGFSQRGNERILRESFWKYDEVLLNATLHYSTSLGENHSLSSFVGLENLNSDTRNFWAEKRGFPTPDHAELFAGSDEGQQSYGISSESARMDFFGSLSYDFKKKYFIDLTLRHDGSSNFGPGKRYGTFPSAAASWALDQENFLAGSNWISSLKLRASWSKMGNDRIAPFQYLTRYQYGGIPNTPQPNYYIFGSPGVALNGYTASTVPNPDVTWETAKMQNIGLSFGFFDGKLSGDFNYFHQKRENILATRVAAIPDYVGLELPAENFGEVKNYGVEFELAWNHNLGDFNYNLGANFSQAKSEVLYLAEAADVPEALKREGKPIDSYIVYPTDGIFRDQAEVESTPVKLDGTVEGEPKYLDTNGDGTINADDRIRVGSSNIPEIQYGIFGGFSYKNLDFNFLLQGQAKAETLVFFDQNGAKPDYVFNQRWTPSNRDSRYPRAFGLGDPYSGNQSGNADNFQGADFWLHDASFVRLKEVELAYTIPEKVVGFGNLRLFLRGYNLLTMFSDIYDLGLDPEATGYNNFRDATYTPLKTYTVGLNLSF